MGTLKSEMRKRAGGALEKEERRIRILAFADSLFREKAYDEIRMADLADELGLAKGTLYLYFSSKEALFLALLEERLRAAFDALSSGLSDARGKPSADEVATKIADTMAADPALPRLLAYLHPTLEQKLPYEEAVAFKRRLYASLSSAARYLAASFPPLKENDAFRFLLHIYAHAIGLVSVSEFSPFVRRLSSEPGLGALKMDFRSSLEDFCRAMLARCIEAAQAR